VAVLGAELRRLREAAGLTQEAAAVRAKLSREYVSHIEREVYSPSVEVFVRLCTALGTPAWKVLRRLDKSAE
jgi:transcriptional regulator with XRE-family HTH domain